MRRAGIYVRISQDRGGTALGVKRQEADCRTLCDRQGWTVADVYVDNDVSASGYRRRVRKEYRRLCDDLKAGVIDTVVAWDPDRLHRQPAELEAFIALVDATAAHVATVNGGTIDLSTAHGRMTARVVGAVARHEVEHKSERLRRKHVELAEAGKVPGGGRRPFGYEADRVTVRADEADLIREAVQRVILGESLRGIVLDWRARGVPTVTGVPWSPTTVRRLLRSDRIAGRRNHRGKVTGAVWPAIITAEDSARVRAALAARADGQVGRTYARRYLLTGVVTCDLCGHRLTARPMYANGKVYPRYFCWTERGGCGRLGINADHLDAYVSEMVIRRLRTPAVLRRATTATDPTAEVVAELQRIAERREQIADALVSGAMGPELAGQADRKLAAAEDAQRRRLDRLQHLPVVADVAGPDAAARWETLNLDRRRALVAAVTESVVVMPRIPGRQARFDRERLRITWRR